MENKTHVVVGATGALGTALVSRLLGEGFPVRAVVRDLEKAQAMLPEGTDIAEANVTETHSLALVCGGAAAIYNAVYVPGAQWDGVTENFLHAAHETGARLVFPSNIHPYGPLQQVPATEDHPYYPGTKRGQTRIRIETQLLDAQKAGEAEIIIPRFAAFYGPGTADTFVGVIFEDAINNRKAWWFGSLDSPYDFLYTDDAATACILLATGENTTGQVWHVPGAGPLTARQFIEMVYHATGKVPQMSLRQGWAFKVAGLVFPNAKSMSELMYEFEQPLVMDGGKFERAFPDFEYTPHEDAIAQTLEWFQNR
jgi:nucleoside-diphosphate-sugar epimerase